MEKKYSEGEFQELVLDQFKSVHTELKIIKTDIGEMKDVLYPLAKAFDIDSEKLIDHNKRIVRVEKHLGFKSA